MDVVAHRRVGLKQADSPLASSWVKASAGVRVDCGVAGILRFSLLGKNYGTAIGVRKSLFLIKVHFERFGEAIQLPLSFL